MFPQEKKQTTTFRGPDNLQHLHALESDAAMEESEAELNKHTGRCVGCITQWGKPFGKQSMYTHTCTHAHTMHTHTPCTSSAHRKSREEHTPDC